MAEEGGTLAFTSSLPDLAYIEELGIFGFIEADPKVVGFVAVVRSIPGEGFLVEKGFVLHHLDLHLGCDLREVSSLGSSTPKTRPLTLELAPKTLVSSRDRWSW